MFKLNVRIQFFLSSCVGIVLMIPALLFMLHLIMRQEDMGNARMPYDTFTAIEGMVMLVIFSVGYLLFMYGRELKKTYQYRFARTTA